MKGEYDFLRDWFVIDEKSPSGLIWAKHASSKCRAGSPALTTVNNHGYYGGTLGYKRQMAHRVVFFLSNGFMPPQVDHIDGDTRNNRVENLRSVTGSENQHNRIAAGMYYNKKDNRYWARIQVSGKRISLGYYKTAEEAHAAYLEAKKKMHPSAPDRCYVEIRPES